MLIHHPQQPPRGSQANYVLVLAVCSLGVVLLVGAISFAVHSERVQEAREAEGRAVADREEMRKADANRGLLSQTPVIQQPATKKRDVELLDEAGAVDSYGVTVEGHVRNNTSGTVGSIWIEFAIYDLDGNKVGTAWDSCTDLRAGETWKFKAVSFDRDGRKYRLSGLKWR